MYIYMYVYIYIYAISHYVGLLKTWNGQFLPAELVLVVLLAKCSWGSEKIWISK